MNLLEKARKYEALHGAEVAAEERPLFHISAQVGWLNDPNGFSFYKGKYHQFFQYHPYSNHWGPMHWGHCVSDDMTKWEYLPAVLAPDQPYETGCFSGSALTLDDGRQLFMYTSHLDHVYEDGSTGVTETQSLAFGDGLNYEKYEGNPVITAADLPEGASSADFRDPKIWREEDGTYACVTVGRDLATDEGQVYLFRSPDAIHWTYEQTLEKSGMVYGDMWECPDFFRLDGKDVLLVGCMNMRAPSEDFRPGNCVIAIIGEYDRATKTWKHESIQALDMGFDFYASQTMVGPDGRCLLSGWMESVESGSCIRHGAKWQCMLSYPRELHVKDGRIYQLPVREIEKYYQNPVTVDEPAFCGTQSYAGVSGRVLDLTAEVSFEDSACKTFAMKFAANSRFETVVSYDTAAGKLTVNRMKAGGHHDIANLRTFPVKLHDGKLKLRLLLDRFSGELFLNDGEYAFSLTLYETPQDAQDIVFMADAPVALHIEKHDIVID